MLFLEKMSPRTITSANYITSVNGMLHPTRMMSEHDFLYILDGTWEVIEEGIPYELQTDDLLILCAGRHTQVCGSAIRVTGICISMCCLQKRSDVEINSRDYLNGKKAAWNMEKKIRRKYAWIKWKPQKAAKIRAFCAVTRLSTVGRSRRSASISMN